jgi:hypothetical protein
MGVFRLSDYQGHDGEAPPQHYNAFKHSHDPTPSGPTHATLCMLLTGP